MSARNAVKIKLVIKRLLYICILGTPFLGLAQKISFEHLDVEAGLSQNSVLSIVQDSRGFLWFATRRGLNRYDGTRFKSYIQNDSAAGTISDNYVVSLISDSRHTLWAGTLNGINKYVPETDSFERILPGKGKGSLSSKTVNCIYEDKKGNTWIGTVNGLNLLTDSANNKFRAFYTADGLAGNNVRAIYDDNEGNLWIGTDGGLTCMKQNKAAYTFETFRHIENNTASLTDNYVVTITGDTTNNLWIGTQNGGVNFFDKKRNTFSRIATPGIASNSIRKIIFDNQGRLWIGTQEGLFVLNAETKTGTVYRHDPSDKKSLSQNSIYSIYKDANGSIWIGTYFGGTNVVYPYSNSFTVWQNSEAPNSINNNVVGGITEDGHQNLWIATEGGGINYLNRTTGKVTVYKNKPGDETSLGSNLVKTIYRDRDGNIWAGTHGGGLNLFDATRNRFIHFIYKANDPQTSYTEIPAILEDSHGRFWTGSQEGIKLFRRNNKALEPFRGQTINGLAEIKSVKVIFEDAQKNIWVGANWGMFFLENNSNEFKFLKSFPTTGINCIQQDNSGNIWAGLYYGGLIMYDKRTSKITAYTDKQGLPNNNVLSIQADEKGNLWIATGNGLSRFDIKSQTFQNYTSTDGLAGNEFNYNSFYKSANGEMFFGGFNGLTGFFPGKIETNRFAAPLVFTSLKLFNNPVATNGEDGLLSKDISLTNNIRFKYNQDVFTIDFALLNYIKSNKNRYAYKLEGLDKNWNETNTASVTYTHLPEGNYTLLVKGANNDGVWSKPASLQITVLPPFWKTWWAYLLYIALLAAVLFFVTRFFFLRELIKKEDALHQFKLNFFTNISHEIRTHLALIIGPIERLIFSTKEDASVSKQLLSVKKNADRLLKLVSEQMDFRKAETGHLKLQVSKENIVSFMEEIYNSFQNVSVSRNIKSSFVSDSSDIDLYVDKEQLEKVFFNLLSNAYKFTPDGGKVSVLIKENKAGIEINITDNGKGIAPENLDKLFDNFYQEHDYGKQNTGYGIGLALSKSIVELHKGKLKVESEIANTRNENRTCFTVLLLHGHKHFDNAHFVTDDTVKTAATMPQIIPAVESIRQPITEKINPAFTDKTFTVLLVEDNTEVRSFIKESLNSQYHILEAVNGLKGWEAATETIPDLIISDVMMPEMDGLTLCHQLKSDERTSHIPVIMLTAKSSTDNHVSGLEMGADIYLTKPFSIRVLQLHIQNLLTSREKMRQRFNAQFNVEEVREISDPDTITVVNKVDQQFLTRAIQIVEEHIDDPEFGVAMFSTKVAMSPPVLYKKLKAVTDMSVNDFIKSLRMQKALSLLQQGKTDAYDVAYMVGYKDKKYFTKEFKKYFGKAPGEYQKQCGGSSENS